MVMKLNELVEDFSFKFSKIVPALRTLGEKL